MLFRVARGFVRRIPVAFVIVVSVVIASFVLVNVAVEAKLASAEHVDLSLADGPSGGGANYLLIGSDTRSVLNEEGDDDAFGTQDETGPARSDTIMVLHVDPDSARSLLVSFPRDLWVDIPGRGAAKINAAFNEGPQSVVDTISSEFDVPIQHYVEVNFVSFRDIVDAIGTVPVYFPAPARDKKSNLTILAPGCFQLDGPSALSFVRSRNLEILDPETGEWTNADPIPDLGRIARQQAFLREVGKRAMDAALSNPLKANDIIDGAIGKLRIDDGFGRTDAFNLADAFVSGGGPESLTIPTEGATRDGQDVLEATGDAEGVIARLRDFDSTIPAAPEVLAGGDREPVLISNRSGAPAPGTGPLAPVPGC